MQLPTHDPRQPESALDKQELEAVTEAFLECISNLTPKQRNAVVHGQVSRQELAESSKLQRAVELQRQLMTMIGPHFTNGS